MAQVTYEVFAHDGGWAYRVGQTISETFASRAEADKAAERAAREQRAPGETGPIEYETPQGEWVEETARGADRPQTHVKA